MQALESPPITASTTCRCGARVEATSPENLRAMLAGHWMFDEDHQRFVDAEATK